MEYFCAIAISRHNKVLPAPNSPQRQKTSPFLASLPKSFPNASIVSILPQGSYTELMLTTAIVNTLTEFPEQSSRRICGLPFPATDIPPR